MLFGLGPRSAFSFRCRFGTQWWMNPWLLDLGPKQRSSNLVIPSESPLYGPALGCCYQTDTAPYPFHLDMDEQLKQVWWERMAYLWIRFHVKCINNSCFFANLIPSLLSISTIDNFNPTSSPIFLNWPFFEQSKYITIKKTKKHLVDASEIYYEPNTWCA